jgi:hypothetical protein
MNGLSLLLATLALSVDYGWQHTADGQLEYILQIEPVTLEALNEGREIESQVHPFVRPLRRFRIRVGTETLPRPTNRQAATRSLATVSAAQLPLDQFGWQPVDNEQTEFIVQVAPARLALLRRGEEIRGEIPAEAGNVARLRIRAGTDRLPRQTPQRGAVAVDAYGQPRTTEPLLPTATNLGQPQFQPSTTLASQRTAGGYTPQWSGTGDMLNSAANPTAGLVGTTGYAGAANRNDASPALPQFSRQNQFATDPRNPSMIGSGTTAQPAYRTATSGSTSAGSWWPDWNPSTGTVPRNEPADPRGWNAVNSPSGSAPRTDNQQPGWNAGGYATSNSGYAQPNATYSAYSPTGGNAQPNASYAQPATGYAQPNTGYAPAGGGYAQPPAGTNPALYPYEGPAARVANQNSALHANASHAPNNTDDFWRQLNQSANGRNNQLTRPTSLDWDDGKRPWGPLMMTVVALFASVGANVYMGMVVARTYWRYLDLTSELGEEGRREVRGDDDEDDSRRSRRERAAA